MQTENLEGQESIFDRDSGSGKMSSVLSQVGGTLKRVKKSLGRIFKKSSKRSSKLKNHTFMLLDLRPGAGNMLGAYWEYDPPWLGSFGTLNTSECPKDAVECSLWQILQATAPSRYSLSQTACLGILRRAACRGKSLPPLLEAALRMQAGLDPPAPISGEAKAYHINQRNEGIDLDGVSGALMATQNLQMQTFITNPGINQNDLQKRMAFAANQRDEVRDLHDVAGSAGDETANLCRWIFCWSWRERRDHWISGGRSAHAERQPQRKLYAQHPLYQRSGRADHGVQRGCYRDAAGAGTRTPTSGPASGKAFTV